MTELTNAQIVVMSRQFDSDQCPVCSKWKQRRWCFCKSCYFTLKTAKPKLAAGLWHEAFDETNRFFEAYAEAKLWLASTGLGKLKGEQGGLFA